MNNSRRRGGGEKDKRYLTHAQGRKKKTVLCDENDVSPADNRYWSLPHFSLSFSPFSLHSLHSLSFLSCEERKVCKILQETPSFFIFPVLSCFCPLLLTTTRPLIEMHDQSSLLSCLLWLLWAISISSSPAVSQEKKKRQEKEKICLFFSSRGLCVSFVPMIAASRLISGLSPSSSSLFFFDKEANKRRIKEERERESCLLFIFSSSSHRFFASLILFPPEWFSFFLHLFSIFFASLETLLSHQKYCFLLLFYSLVFPSIFVSLISSFFPSVCLPLSFFGRNHFQYQNELPDEKHSSCITIRFAFRFASLIDSFIIDFSGKGKWQSKSQEPRTTTSGSNSGVGGESLIFFFFFFVFSFAYKESCVISH